MVVLAQVLRGDKDHWKLCDFGSASTDTYIAKTSGDRVTIQAIVDSQHHSDTLGTLRRSRCLATVPLILTARSLLSPLRLVCVHQRYHGLADHLHTTLDRCRATPAMAELRSHVVLLRVCCCLLPPQNTTPSYRAPEMVDLYRPAVINQQADIWALGVMLYQLLFKEQPFPDGTLGIASGKYRIPETHRWSKEVMDLLSRMLCVDPAKRATIVEVQVAVGELTKKNPRMADPWALPFTSATLAASAAAVSLARSKSPQLLSPKSEVSTSHGSRNGAASPDPTEGGGKKKDKAGKKGKKKEKPPVPAFGADDFGASFDASFPAPVEGGEEGKAAAGAFISPELMQVKGLQWEEDQGEGEAEEKAQGERKRQEGEPADPYAEEEAREPSGNGEDRPRAASFSGPPSPSPVSPAPPFSCE